MNTEIKGPKVSVLPLGEVPDADLAFAVIVSRHRGKWIWCRHRERDTFEVPGGRREPGEAILDTARRELYEETGAAKVDLQPIGVYCVDRGSPSYGLLCFAEVEALGPLPRSEIAEIHLLDEMPKALTYPEIQPVLFAEIRRRLG